MPSRRQLLVGLDREADFAPGGDEDELRYRRPARRRAHRRPCATPAADAISAAVERRQRLTRQDQHGRLMPKLQIVSVGLDHLVRIARPQQHKAWNRAQRNKLLDRLVRGPSSPSPIASCVKTKTSGNSISAERRIAGRA